jgi:hypothetical protein
MPSNSDPGILHVPSQHTVEQTVQKLHSMIEAKGAKVFALVDHSGEAAKAGLQMRPTKLLIFGSPQAGSTFRSRSWYGRTAMAGFGFQPTARPTCRRGMACRKISSKPSP